MDFIPGRHTLMVMPLWCSNDLLIRIPKVCWTVESKGLNHWSCALRWQRTPRGFSIEATMASLVACSNQIRCCFGHIIMTSSSSKPCRTQSSFLSPLNDYFPKLSDKITNVTVSGLTCYTSVHFVSHGVRTTLILILNTMFRLEKPEWWEETLHQHSKHLWMQFLNFMPPSSLQLL